MFAFTNLKVKSWICLGTAILCPSPPNKQRTHKDDTQNSVENYL